MPLSHADDRNLIHTRTIDLKVYRRSDDCYDVEGHIMDVKPFPHHMLDSHRAAGEPIHDLWLRLTFDTGMNIVKSEAKLDVGAHGLCHQVEPNFAELAGLHIGPGWNREVRKRVGHGKGCTHLVEMLAQMATAAMQAMWSEREPDGEVDRPAEERSLEPGLLDTCYAYRTDSEFVRDFFPKHYETKE
ncbi:MAG: DUF2889 domain-containing protein [Alphaproteobacteria bacterium]|nr:DUF2889 domain-containing protein [Alphaproteobacteria bacterium]